MLTARNAPFGYNSAPNNNRIAFPISPLRLRVSFDRSLNKFMPKTTIEHLTACLALTLATAVPTIGVAQTTATAPQSTGSISGRVQNIATGQYLNNARVSVRGSNNTVFTDKDGTYRLVNVPSGPVTLEVFFTDLDLATVSLIVPPGGLLTQDVNLTSIARYGQQGDGTVKLDAFIVAQDKETDAQAIATNEQRFAPNIKNVMSTDSLGDVLGARSVNS